MVAAKSTESEFLAAMESSATLIEVAQKLGVGLRNVNTRRRYLEDKLQMKLFPGRSPRLLPSATVPERQEWRVDSGQIVVFSDAHYWPGEPSTAHRALLKYLELYGHKVVGVVNNGDSLDGAKISRHPPHGWSTLPSVKEEMDANKLRLGEILERTPKAEHIWSMGNHCQRFEARLAAAVPEYATVEGFDLGSHFPDWQFTISTWVNDDLVIKHRYKGGIHAAHNNTVTSGRSIVTGHLHSLKVTPWTDYNGTRWGVDTGTLADPFGPQFEYAEDGPRNWRSGFAVLTIVDGKLIDPELLRVAEPGRVVFQGRIHDV
jgi:hypothetical protein